MRNVDSHWPFACSTLSSCRTSKSLVLQQLPELTEEHVKAAVSVTGRFVGNPAKLLGPDADAADEEEEEAEAEEEGGEEGAERAPKPPKRVKFSEAHRLRYAVGRIDSECGVVPRGAFAVTPTHHIVRSPAFAGLSASEADMLASYSHFKPAEGARRGALARAAALGAGDFLDPLTEDEPAGIWSVVLSLGRGSVQLRNARWPGYFFWHAFSTPSFGSLYHGDGRRNDDISWMI